MSDPDLAPGDFSGVVRLFPLPDLVMFPHIVQPLRVFEPRYVQMFEDAIAGDRLITLALLKSGWEQDYGGRPPVHPVACLGRIISHNRNQDGTYNLLLAGLNRVRIGKELQTAHEFRSAEAELLDELEPSLPPETTERIRKQLIATFQRLTSPAGESDEPLKKLIRADLSLSMLTDAIAYSSPLAVEQKQSLLSNAEVRSRAEALIGYLHDLTTGDKPSPGNFPPNFSEN